MSFFDTLTSLFAPDDCLSCGREGALLCSPCSLSLPGPRGTCFGCYADIPSGVVCPACLSQSGCSGMQAAVDYSAAAKQLLAHLKFLGNQSAARVMADCMLTLCNSLPPDVLITHMPATTQHIRERGFDQAALLTRHLARSLAVERRTLLARVGQKHQLGADRQERLAQLQGALRLTRSSLVAGRSVLLIDDVLTTGSSLRAATAALLDAGAHRVDALVFAQAAPS